MNVKQMYESFLESKELFDLMPDASGEWEKDKNAFMKAYEELVTIVYDADDVED